MAKKSSKVKNKSGKLKGGWITVVLFVAAVMVLVFRDQVTETVKRSFPRLKADFLKEDYVQEFDEQLERVVQLLENSPDRKRITELYEKYYSAEKMEQEQFRKQVEEKWGDYIGSTVNDWVEYSDDASVRSQVDFEKGLARIEILVDPMELKDDKFIEKKIYAAVIKLFKSHGKTKNYKSMLEAATIVSQKPILESQLSFPDGGKVTFGNLDRFIDRLIRRKQIHELSIPASGKSRSKIVLQFELSRDHLEKRRDLIHAFVDSSAQKYNLPSSLIYAVIHTESHFNPLARSNVPAYGLMQLVPQTGARDAYRFITGADGLVTSNYLYDIKNNIELGSAYLYLLKNKYFAEIRDSLSQTYCMIAAYNTGPGNVSRAFVSPPDLETAIEKINDYPAAAVYDKLLSGLPYRETRDYLRKVTLNLQEYSSKN